MTKKELETLFYTQLKRTVLPENNEYFWGDSKEHYFNNKYRSELIKLQKDDGVYAKFRGLEYRKFGEGQTKICSIGSSSRLYYFHNRKKLKDGFEFEFTEYHFNGDNGDDNCAHFDGKEGKVLFEAKCQELLTTSHSGLKKDFYDKLVKEGFGIDTDFKTKTIVKDEKEQTIIVPTQSQFNIGKKDNSSIYNMHFDVKQLITHLLALGARQDKSEVVTLQYVLFKPIDDENESLKKNLYDVVDDEFESIRTSRVFSKFLDKNAISLPKIKYVVINPLEDCILFPNNTI